MWIDDGDYAFIIQTQWIFGLSIIKLVWVLGLMNISSNSTFFSYKNMIDGKVVGSRYWCVCNFSMNIKKDGMGPRFSFKAQLRFGLGSGWAFVIRFGVPEGQSFLLDESLINLNSTHRVLFSTWDIPQMVVFQLFLKNGYIFLKKIVYTHA